MKTAQQIINESKEQDWTSENFQEWLYNTPEEDQKENNSTKLTSFYEPFFLNTSSSGDIQFKFNYNHGNKEPLEELGIEVIK